MKRVGLCGWLLLLTFTGVFGQDKWNITELGNWDVDTLPATSSNTYNDCWGYVDCAGNEYGLLGSAALVHFIDVSNPQNPVEIDAYAGGATTIWRDIKTWKQHAYSVCDFCSEGLQVFDLSMLPDTVVKTNQTDQFFKSCHNIFIDEEAGWLYAVGTNTQGNGIIILDLNSDPDHPTQLAKLSLPGGYIHDLYVRDSIAYCSHGSNGLYVYDFSTPTAPVLLGSLTLYPESGYNHSCWLSEAGDYLVFADETHNKGLKLADVSDLTDMYVTDVFRSALLGPADTASIAHNPFIRDNYIFVSYYHDGMQVFDFSNPDEVTKVAYFDTHPGNANYNGYDGCWGVYPFLPSGNILASDQEHGLFILSLDSIDLTPTEVTLFPETELALPAGGPDLCEGETAVLLPIGEAAHYQWFQEDQPLGQSPALQVSEPGNYWAQLSNAYCEVHSDTIQITVSPLPEVFLFADEASGCAGDTIWMAVQTNSGSYSWYQDETLLAGIDNQPLVGITAPGNVFVEGQLGICSNASDTIAAAFLPLPQVELSAAPWPACPGDTVWITALSDADSLAWYENGIFLENAANAVQIPATMPASFTVEAFLEECTFLSAPINVAFQPAPTPVIIPDLESRTLAVDQIGIIYQWFFDGQPIPNATMSTFTFSESGIYAVEVVYANGCAALSGPLQVTINAVGDVQERESIRIFPNPASTTLFLQISDWKTEDVRVSILDSRGVEVLSQRLSPTASTGTIHLPEWPEGVYWVRVYSEERVWVQKIMVVRHTNP